MPHFEQLFDPCGRIYPLSAPNATAGEGFFAASWLGIAGWKGFSTRPLPPGGSSSVGTACTARRSCAAAVGDRMGSRRGPGGRPPEVGGRRGSRGRAADSAGVVVAGRVRPGGFRCAEFVDRRRPCRGGLPAVRRVLSARSQAGQRRRVAGMSLPQRQTRAASPVCLRASAPVRRDLLYEWIRKAGRRLRRRGRCG